MKKISFVLFIAFFISCSNEKKEGIYIPGFNSNEWKSDSLGCLGVRKQLCTLLNDSINAVKWHTLNQLVEFLGSPNISQKNGDFLLVSYFVGGGRQCFDTTWRDKKYSDVEQINYFINKKHQVVGTTGVIYP